MRASEPGINLRRVSPALLLEPANRGLLLDVVVLVANLFAMPLLTDAFVRLMRRASSDDPGALWTVFGFAVALLVLAPLGATLKRWHYHRQRAERQDTSSLPGGCLFSPIFYFCLMVVIMAVVNAFLMHRFNGGREPNGAVFVTSILAGLGLVILHTFLVYRYFSPPRRAPQSAFLRSARAEFIGDACLFTNMLIFQVAWNSLSFAGLGAPGSVLDAVLRLGMLFFLALLIYFPPRMFYLADDIHLSRTWVMILLANSPVIVRMLVGTP